MIKPTGEKVVVEFTDAPLVRQSGIVLPDTAKERPLTYED